jgi:3-hydroxybutyryl-CoA dehydrogenase
MKKIGILGAGTMGAGITQALVQNGYDVVLRARRQASVDGGIAKVAKNLERLVAKEKITAADKDAMLARIEGSTDISVIADVDLVIEAATEDLESKKALFVEIDKLCKPETIIATNTSSLSITELASVTERPDKIIGIHFFNPVHIMKLVEIISGALTAPYVVDEAKAFVEAIGKVAVYVKKDSPGFIVNRLLVPYLNEAVRLVEEGVASPEDIDTAVEFGLNYPVGPFKMIDTGGVDLTVTVLDYFKEEFADNAYAPRRLLRQMLRSGKTGKKAGEGFYKYGDD